MFPWKRIVLASLAAVAVQAAVVYKWTDHGGVVHYSDQPVPGAEKIITAGRAPAGGGESPGRSMSSTAPNAAPVKKPATGTLFTQMAIVAPSPEQTFFGDEVINVLLALQPELRPNQSITWFLNGQELHQDAVETHFSLKSLDRGTYSLSATVVDQDSGLSQSADNISFFVRQPSVLSPQHQGR